MYEVKTLIIAWETGNVRRMGNVETGGAARLFSAMMGDGGSMILGFTECAKRQSPYRHDRMGFDFDSIDILYCLPVYNGI